MAERVDPLDSPRYRIDHAKLHAQSIEREFRAFMDEEPYALIDEFDADKKLRIVKLKLIKPIPRKVSAFTDDAFGNLRSALDQLGFAVARARGGRGKKSSFPFGDSETECRSRITGNSKELPKEIFNLMVSFEPYAGGDDLLWALNEICNTGKHRMIRPVLHNIGDYKLSGLNVSFSGPGFIGGGWDSAKNELHVFGYSGESQYSIDNLEFSSAIVFGDIKIVGGQPVLGVFDTLARKVESILMAVEAEGRRIGIFN